jgi:hypothetical protein
LIHSLHSKYYLEREKQIIDLRKKFESRFIEEQKTVNSEQKSIEKPLIHENVLKNNDSGKIIDYFGPKVKEQVGNSSHLSFKVTAEKIGINFYTTLVFDCEELKAFKLLLGLIISNIHLFEMKISDSLESNSFWFVASNVMIDYGYKKWVPRKCRDSYSDSIDLYKEV